MVYKFDILNFATKGLIRESDVQSKESFASVLNFAALPDATQNNGSVYLVQTATGLWPFNFKQKGLYRSDGASWNCLGVEYDTTSIKVGESIITASPIIFSSSDSSINITANLETNTIDLTLPVLDDIQIALTNILGG